MADHEDVLGLPTDEQLEQLRPAACVAVAARCALRALPLITEFGKRGHRIEGAVRSVQGAVAACTAQVKLHNASYALTGAGRNSPGDILSSSANLVLIKAAAATAHLSQFRRPKEVFIHTIEALEVYVRAAKIAGASPSLAAQAIWGDFDVLRGRQGSESSPISSSFFASPLWPDEERAFWAEKQVEWRQAFSEKRSEWEIETYFRLAEGRFDPEIEAESFNRWVFEQEASGKASREPVSEPRAAVGSGSVTSDKRAAVAHSPDMGKGQSSPPQGVATKQSDAASPGEMKPTESRSGRMVETRLDNDSTSGGDALNRATLARVIAAFLRDERTQTPLALSVEGHWGSGKTKFMKLLQVELDPPKGTPEPQRRVRTVWFNPWRHQSHEELWAAFALTVLGETRKHLSWWPRLLADLKLGWSCLDRRRFWRSASGVFVKVAAFAVVLVVFASFAEAGWQPNALLEKMQTARFWLDFIGVPIAVGGPLILLGQTATWLWKGFSGHLRHDLEIHLERPNYQSRTSFLAEFHRDFADAVSIYTKGLPVVVFIDDLDRCDVPRAAELMQGINLMLGEQVPLIYVLGIDRAKVAAGIAVKHRELLPFLYARELAGTGTETETRELRARGLEYGYEFIEKFIQLPFRLPPNEGAELRTFIRSRLTRPEEPPQTTQTAGAQSRQQGVATGGETIEATEYLIPDAEATAPDGATGQTNQSDKLEPPPEPEVVSGDESHLEEPLLHAARVLEGNPRRIAQLVNLVRLQRMLAPVLRVNVADGQLAKWTAVALRWPVFLVELEQERDLLANLVMEADPATQSDRYKHWNAQTRLVKFLRDRGPAGAKVVEYDLTQTVVVDALLRLGVAVPVAEVGTGGAERLSEILFGVPEGETSKSAES